MAYTRKVCSECYEVKDYSEFPRDKQKPDGLGYLCKPCNSQRSSKYYAENTKKCKAEAKERYNRDIDASRAYYAKRGKAWIRANPAKNAARSARVYAERLKRTPAWADFDKIREFYEEAQRLTEKTGVKYSVDHIIPLKGKKISGLHVETNLQVIPLSENIRKNNNFET